MEEQELIKLKQNKHIESLDVYFQRLEDTGSLIPHHWHNALEIVYLLSGELEITIEQRTLTLQAGEITVINSRDIHSAKCRNGNTTLFLRIPDTSLKNYIPEMKDLRFEVQKDTNPKQLARMKTILLEMYQVTNEKPKGGKLKFTSLLFELVYGLVDTYGKLMPRGVYGRREKNQLRLEPILRYTLEHYMEHITLEMVAKLVYLQPEYFCRFFKKHMGQTYLEYLNTVRLSHIYQDLLHTEEPLNYLLVKHGFTNYKLFRKMFKEQFGEKPMQIRQQHRGTKDNSSDTVKM